MLCQLNLIKQIIKSASYLFKIGKIVFCNVDWMKNTLPRFLVLAKKWYTSETDSLKLEGDKKGGLYLLHNCIPALFIDTYLEVIKKMCFRHLLSPREGQSTYFSIIVCTGDLAQTSLKVVGSSSLGSVVSVPDSQSAAPGFESWGPFLERPGNLTGPKPSFKIKI